VTSTNFANPVITEDTILAKEALRKEMRTRLAAMDEAEIATKSGKIVAKLKSSGWLRPGATVALFGGIEGEPDLLELVPWLVDRGATPVFFGFANGQLLPQRVAAVTDLVRGVFGVWMPPEGEEVVPHEKLDVILTPGLAFGADGTRLGRGRGFYDKLFGHPEVKAQRIGIGWEFQQVETVPNEPHDALMETVVLG